jgi:hypothetical protein
MPDDSPQEPMPETEVRWSPAPVSPSRRSALLRVLFGGDPARHDDAEVAS